MKDTIIDLNPKIGLSFGRNVSCKSGWWRRLYLPRFLVSHWWKQAFMWTNGIKINTFRMSEFMEKKTPLKDKQCNETVSKAPFSAVPVKSLSRSISSILVHIIWAILSIFYCLCPTVFKPNQNFSVGLVSGSCLNHFRTFGVFRVIDLLEGWPTSHRPSILHPKPDSWCVVM